MTMTTLETGQYSGSQRPPSGFIAYLRSKWNEHRLMRSIEAVPYEVMKDVGYPAAERKNAM